MTQTFRPHLSNILLVREQIVLILEAFLSQKWIMTFFFQQNINLCLSASDLHALSGTVQVNLSKSLISFSPPWRSSSTPKWALCGWLTDEFVPGLSLKERYQQIICTHQEFTFYPNIRELKEVAPGYKKTPIMQSWQLVISVNPSGWDTANMWLLNWPLESDPISTQPTVQNI